MVRRYIKSIREVYQFSTFPMDVPMDMVSVLVMHPVPCFHGVMEQYNIPAIVDDLIIFFYRAETAIKGFLIFVHRIMIPQDQVLFPWQFPKNLLKPAAWEVVLTDIPDNIYFIGRGYSIPPILQDCFCHLNWILKRTP